MKERLKRITGLLLVVSVIAGDVTMPVNAAVSNNLRQKNYVVLAESHKEDVVNELVEDTGICDEVLDTDDVYAVKVNATKEQIEELSEEKGVTVSEDVILVAASKNTKHIKNKEEKKTSKKQAKKKADAESEWNIKMINADSDKYRIITDKG